MPDEHNAPDDVVTEPPGLADLLSAIDAEQVLLRDIAGEIPEIAAEPKKGK